MEHDEVVLGMRYTDRITKITGIATGVHNYLNGCQRITLSPPAIDGKLQDPIVMDVEDAIYVDDGVKHEPKPTGGPTRFEPKGVLR